MYSERTYAAHMRDREHIHAVEPKYTLKILSRANSEFSSQGAALCHRRNLANLAENQHI